MSMIFGGRAVVDRDTGAYWGSVEVCANDLAATVVQVQRDCELNDRCTGRRLVYKDQLEIEKLLALRAKDGKFFIPFTAFVLIPLALFGAMAILDWFIRRDDPFSNLSAARSLCENKISPMKLDLREARLVQTHCVESLKASFPKIVYEEEQLFWLEEANGDGESCSGSGRFSSC